MEQAVQGDTQRALLITLAEHRLLLPSSVVAEVVGHQEPSRSPVVEEQDRHWILGTVQWRQQRLALVSLEGYMSGQSADFGLRARVVVMKALYDHPRLSYYAVVAQQIPRLATVHPQSIEALEGEEGGDLPGVAQQVLVNGEPALIPDLAAVEADLHRAMYS